jgi:hypothetical protein
VNDEDVEDCNIETQENLKIIKLSKMLSPEVKQDYIKLMKDFPDVFAWSYDDLKVYDTKVIQHVIPLKEDQKNFKQKSKMDQSPAVVTNRKGGKEIIRSQNYRFFKIFEMGRQPGACKEKER